MKCQKCGKNEVNFHYSSNVNGCVTEAHLCSECAENSGYELGRIFDHDGIFGSLIPSRNPSHLGFSGFMPLFMSVPMIGFGVSAPFAAMPELDKRQSGCSCGGSCSDSHSEAPAAEVDAEMQKQRELGVIREQMRLAAEKEDYEKAIQLRDKLKELER